MTPKEKAKEMYIKFDFVYVQNYTSKFEVKRCALIAVDEVIYAFSLMGKGSSFYDAVKKEIELL
jgi:hypothetical protein